jgi:hypothetical protein
MRRVNAPGISPTEWRWVIIFSGLMVAITLIPYAWAFASDAPNDSWQFMGMLHNPQDGATYLSKIAEGARGSWLFTLSYSPEKTSGAAIFEFYLLLGHLARFLGFSPLLMYHIARLVTGFIMYISIYYLGSVIWPRLRPRRLFFSLLAVGSGLGWLALVLIPGTGSNPPPDFSIPESIPFLSTFVNPHFPLAIALIALLAGIFVMVFRPGFKLEPTFSNGGLSVIAISIGLVVVLPQALIAIAAALCVYILVMTWRTRRIPQLELSWVLLAILPSVPFYIYYVAVVYYNQNLQVWNTQNITLSPPPWNYILGFGLLLLVAIPGLWRAVRHFERDGDRFMLIWVVVNAILLYAPVNFQRRLSIGMIIPIVYFAVRALEDYWFDHISIKWRDPALIALFVFIIPSNILSLTLPLFGVVNPKAGIENKQLLPAGYGEAIRWLDDHGIPGNVVLATVQPSLWIPAYSNERVVYGHPYETLNAEQKLKEVADWYEKGLGCQELLTKYNVRYIFNNYNALTDQVLDNVGCISKLNLGAPVFTSGSIAVYEVH